MPAIEQSNLATPAALTAEAEARRVFEIPSLDGFRAFAFLLVFLSHTQLNGLVPGGFGVTVFFFLSGYLITTLLRREAEATGRISLWHFYLRRVLRIFPPMYLVILLGLLMTQLGWIEGHVTRLGLAAELFYFVNYYMIFLHTEGGLTPGLGSLWSLAVEEHFYILFPLMYLLLRRFVARPRDQFLALGLLWAAISAWRCALVLHYWHVYGNDFPVQRASLATDTRLDSILIGCMLAIHENPVLDRSRFSDGAWMRLLWVGIAALLVSFFLPGVLLRESIRYSIQNWALAPVFVCAIKFPGWGPFRLLNVGWIKFIGVLSYSLYLIHSPILHAVDHRAQPRPLQACIGLVLSIAVSYVIYLAVERPCARLRKRLSARS